MTQKTARRDCVPAEQLHEVLVQLLTKTALGGVVVIDDAKRFVEANEAAASIFGVGPRGLAGRRMDEFSGAPPNSFAEPWDTVTDAGHFEGETTIYRDDRSTRVVELSGLAGVGPGRHLIFLRDVTEHRQRERRRAVHLVVAKVLLESMTLADALTKLLEAIGTEVGWPVACLWRVDRETDTLRWAGGWRAPSVEPPDQRRTYPTTDVKRHEGMVGQVWANGRASWREDAPSEGDSADTGAIADNGLHTTFAVPLRLAGETVGVLQFFSYDVRRRDEDLLETVEGLDVLLGQFIERARLFEAELKLRKQYQRVAARISALQRVTAALSEAATPADVAEVVLHEGAAALTADCGALALVIDGEFEIVGTMGIERQHMPRTRRFPLSTEGPFAQAARDKEALFVESRDELLSRFPQFLSEMKATVAAMAAIPLCAHGTALGVFGLAFNRPRRFASDDKSLMCTLARQCALALERARLEEAERNRLDNARAGAEAATRAKDEFLAVLSHELRTPLQSILGWSQLLLHGKAPETTVHRAVETIDRNARAQAKLIEDLLDVSRIVAGQMRLEPRKTSLSRVVETAVEGMKVASEAKGVELVCALPTPPPYVSGDAERLTQVVANLLSNSIKFTPRGGRIEVTLEEQAPKARIVVTDTGCGIAADLLPHIFERFNQGDCSSRRSHRGLGLGLTIVRHLVELHHGTVRADSRGEGKGATFTVELALTSNGGAGADDPDQATPFVPTGTLGGLRVLIVDDDQDTCEFVASVVREAGAAVRAVSSTRAALDVLNEFAPDVLVSDIGMPDADGYALIREVRANEARRGGHLFAVALTAYASHGDREASMAAGFQAHVAKPVKPDELTRIISLSRDGQSHSSYGGLSQ